MSNVASLKLSQQLYEVSEWNDTEKWWHELKDGWSAGTPFSPGDNDIPAYDLGYLFRKFAEQDHYVTVTYVDYVKIAMELKEWREKFIAFDPWMKQGDYPVADSPENALCKLAIALFEQGVLHKGGES